MKPGEIQCKETDNITIRLTRDQFNALLFVARKLVEDKIVAIGWLDDSMESNLVEAKNMMQIKKDFPDLQF